MFLFVYRHESGSKTWIYPSSWEEATSQRGRCTIRSLLQQPPILTVDRDVPSSFVSATKKWATLICEKTSISKSQWLATAC